MRALERTARDYNDLVRRTAEICRRYSAAER